MKIPNIRLQNQQLLNPLFCQPKELVSWLGAMQAQNYSMVKWAMGTRLKSATIQTVEEALRKGEILRTHVMRPTWHLVAAEDIRWMLKLSARRIKSANDSFAKGYDLEITDELYAKSYNLLEKILCGNKSLTKHQSPHLLIKSLCIPQGFCYFPQTFCLMLARMHFPQYTVAYIYIIRL